MATNNGWAHDSEAGVDWRVGGQGRDRGGEVYDWAGDDGGFPSETAQDLREFAFGRVNGPSDDGGFPRQSDGVSQDLRDRAYRKANGLSDDGPYVAPGGGPTRHTHKEKTHNINVGIRANGGGGRGGNGGGGAGNGGGGGYDDRHQGDRLIHLVERIEIRSDKDILALAKAINHLGRELHLILGMRAEEINGVLSTYKGKWYTFGASSRVKARLVSAHLKVSAEAAKALGVGALKMSAAFNRHFVVPEREARQRRNGTRPARKSFSIGEE
ncbi:hypothetical protein [Streptomyces sp. CAI 127]|uniref:hypothetical protein n=1 Tax=Streptomyces sp. CAI 127 TaxID=1076397 RepID=UPI001587A37C|nr:hypothetical protein [Streptomyces sp. CAI 127]NUW04314.1 hypothetical protein [Streptomyces sp. CAI 127]